jgi:hypothetical protein
MILRLQLLPTNYFFDLGKDGALTIDINSTIFNPQQDFIGSISYTGTMPLNEANRKALKNAHYFSTDAALRTLNVMMWLNYLPYKQVRMYFTVQNEIINYNLYIDSSIIANQLKTLQLNDLTVDGVTSQIAFASFDLFKAYMMATATAAPGVYPMVFFPYRNDAAYKPDAYLTYLNYNGAVAYGSGSKFRYGLNHIYQVITNTSAGQTPDTNPEKFTDITLSADVMQPVSKIINRFQLAADGTGSFKVDVAGNPVSQTQTPFFFLTYALQRIALFLGYTLEGNWLKEDDARRLTIFSNIAVGYTNVIADFALFMPAIAVSDFLKECRALFGLLIDFDQTRKIMIVESLSNLQTKAVKVDLRNQQTMGHREISASSQAYTITQQADTKDAAWTGQLLPVLQIGNVFTASQLNAVTLKSVATLMINELMPTDPLIVSPVTNYRTPNIKMPVFPSTPMDQVGTVAYPDRLDFKLRILYYHGMVAGDSGYLYPYGSSDNVDVTGRVLTRFTLDLIASGTAYSAISKFYTFQRNSKPFEMVFELSESLFARIKANTLIIVTDPVLLAATPCILSQLSADFVTGKEMITSTLTLYPIVQPNNAQPVTTNPPEVPPAPPFDNGLVYARFVENNEQINHTTHPTSATIVLRDLVVFFFSDAAGTIPKVVVNLPIRYTDMYETISGVFISKTFIQASGNGNNTLLSAGAEYQYINTEGGTSYQHIYNLAVSAFYTIIS